ncbi:MAG: AMP-binding protein [Rhizobiaceae bacterium]|nr:AMP-binding protein [Rhizobiaceae bacterium]
MAGQASAHPVSLPHLLARNVARYGDRTAYREKEFGIWQTWTWSQAHDEIRAFALGLLTLGVNQGDHIAVVGRNRPALFWSMIAAQMVGAVPVPLYQDAVAEEIVFTLNNCSARFVVAGDQEQVDKIVDARDELKNIAHIVYLDGRGLRKYDHSFLTSYKNLQENGLQSGLEAQLAQRIEDLKLDDTCVMLYTSGTTSNPKGVVLSNRNIIETSKNTCEFDDLTEHEEILAYLPMAWVGDFIFAMGQAMWSGFCVSCPESPDTMQQDLREIGPTYLFAPPAIFERQLTQVLIRMEDASKIKKAMFDHFMAVALEVGPKILDGEKVSLIDRLHYALGNIFVYGPLKDTIGLRRIRVGYTAGEAIGPDLFKFYRSIGINLKQLYGQTEATVFITQQPNGEVYNETVGVPSPGVELKVTDEGEIHYRSPGVFVEYYNNEKSTAETKTNDNWVATGDAGFIDKKTGHLRIIDRVKDVGKMADGSMFAPKYVENKLKFYPEILEAVVFGAGKDRCMAFINIDLTAVGNWAERNNIAYASYQELSQNPQVLDMIEKNVAKVNQSIAEDEMLSSCQIHRFLVLHKELDPDDGEMTRTRKVRRGVIADKFSDLVNALYEDKKTIYTETDVTYEDGRAGKISANLEIRDAAVLSIEQRLAG